MAETRKPLQWHSAVTGPFCSFSYSVLNLFLVRGWPGSGTTSMMSRIRIYQEAEIQCDTLIVHLGDFGLPLKPCSGAVRWGRL